MRLNPTLPHLEMASILPAPTPSFRGSRPLHHIDSVHLPPEESHDPEDSPHVSRRNSSSATLSQDETAAAVDFDTEKGDKLPLGPKRTTTLSAETRQWKDDIVLWDSKSDVGSHYCPCGSLLFLLTIDCLPVAGKP